MTIVTEIGNTPLNPIPDGYLPDGAQPAWLLLDKGFDRGKRLFFYDYVTGPGDPAATLLFVHGNPESSLTYRGIIDHLAGASQAPLRIIAVDHIGFGLSDQADFEMVDMHHAANLTQLVEALDLRDVLLIVHDWGGAIGTGAFLECPDRVGALALMNTTVFPMPPTGLVYTSFPVPVVLGWTHLGRFVPDIFWQWIPPLVMFSPGNQRDFVVKHIPSFIARAVMGRLTPKERIYRQMFRPRNNARAARRHVRQTGVWGHGYDYDDPRHGPQSNRDFYRRLQTELMPSWHQRTIPAAAFFGLWDPCGKPEVQDQWLEALPQLNGRVRRFEGVGHFVEEHRPVEIAEGILELARELSQTP